MRSFEIRNSISLVEKTQGGNNICLYAMNDRDAYCNLEALANCCTKKAKKLGYLDEKKLYESSMLKNITRDIRRRYASGEERFTIQDDRCGRYHLLNHIYEHVEAQMRYGY